MCILEPYIKEGRITLTDWPVEQGQMQAYEDCFEKFSHESKWIGMIDIDEFVVPIDYNSVYDFLSKFEHSSGSVCIYWKNFGTSGILKRNAENSLVTEDFEVCWRKHVDIGKCFVNTMFTCDFSDKNKVTHHEAWTIKNGKRVPPVNCYKHIALFQRYNKIRGRMPIQINHYLVKSYEEMKNKINKGDVFFKNINSYKEYYLMDYEKNNTATDYSVYRYLVDLKIHMNWL